MSECEGGVSESESMGGVGIRRDTQSLLRIQCTVHAVHMCVCRMGRPILALVHWYW